MIILSGVIAYLLFPIDPNVIDIFVDRGADAMPEIMSSGIVLFIKIILFVAIPTFIVITYFMLTFSQVVFILADNPDWSPFQAFHRSAQLMKGSKIKYFGLCFLLNIITNITAFFILPLLWAISYFQTCLACFYNDLHATQEDLV